MTTYNRFPKEIEVWDVSERSPFRFIPLPRFRSRTAFRLQAFLWVRGFLMACYDPATLIWAEALDGGDWNVNVPARDKIMLQKAPFSSPAVEDGADRAAL